MLRFGIDFLKCSKRCTSSSAATMTSLPAQQNSRTTAQVPRRRATARRSTPSDPNQAIELDASAVVSPLFAEQRAHVQTACCSLDVVMWQHFVRPTVPPAAPPTRNDHHYDLELRSDGRPPQRKLRTFRGRLAGVTRVYLIQVPKSTALHPVREFLSQHQPIASQVMSQWPAPGRLVHLQTRMHLSRGRNPRKLRWNAFGKLPVPDEWRQQPTDRPDGHCLLGDRLRSLWVLHEPLQRHLPVWTTCPDSGRCWRSLRTWCRLCVPTPSPPLKGSSASKPSWRECWAVAPTSWIPFSQSDTWRTLSHAFLKSTWPRVGHISGGRCASLAMLFDISPTGLRLTRSESNWGKEDQTSWWPLCPHPILGLCLSPPGPAFRAEALELWASPAWCVSGPTY